MNNLGTIIRKLRDEKKLPLRKVAAFLDMDQALLSRIERGHRKPSREQVKSLAKYFNVSEADLIVNWLSDKVLYEVANEELGFEALQAAEESVNFQILSKVSVDAIISKIKNVLQNDGRVSAAWIFGSISSMKANIHSDVDIMFEFNNKKKYSMFDILDISHSIENVIGRKVDLVEKGQLKDFTLSSVEKNLRKIYG